MIKLRSNLDTEVSHSSLYALHIGLHEMLITSLSRDFVMNNSVRERPILSDFNPSLVSINTCICLQVSD